MIQQYPFTIPKKIRKTLSMNFKPPYNTMQATRLLQHNNPPQNQLSTSQNIIFIGI